MSESEQLQAGEDATRQIIISTARHIAALLGLLGPDLDGAGCIHAIHQFAKGVENCEPVHPPTSRTKRVRAAAWITPSGNWTVLGCPDGDKPFTDKDMVDELFRFCPSEEDNTRICMVDIDLPLPVHNPEEVIQAAGVEEVAE
jgi:hypothetical protein